MTAIGKKKKSPTLTSLNNNWKNWFQIDVSLVVAWNTNGYVILHSLRDVGEYFMKGKWRKTKQDPRAFHVK